MDELRECLRCHETKSITLFAKQKSRDDHHKRTCKRCCRERRHQLNSFPVNASGDPIIPDWYRVETGKLSYAAKKARNPTYARDYARAYKAKHPERYAASLARRRERHRIDREYYRRERGIVVGQNKLCRTCDTVKDLDEFNANSHAPDGRKTICRQCQKDYYWDTRDYRLPQIREYSRQYYREHRDELKEYAREYAKKYYEENREQRAEYSKQYYYENREKLLEYHRKRYQELKARAESDKNQ